MTITDRELRTIADTCIQIRGWGLNRWKPVLTDERIRSRPYLVVYVAACAVAIDPKSEGPTRLYANGPWWEAAYKALSTPDSRPTGPAYQQFKPAREKRGQADPQVVQDAINQAKAAAKAATETHATRARARAEKETT